MLFECKPCKATLSTDHTSQLFRYFSVTEARFAILTNGIVYWFFTDLEQKNKMDTKPFFEFDMLNFRPAQIEELKKFALGNFDVTVILETASDLKYGSALMREIAAEIDSPSKELNKLLIGRVYDGMLTANVLAKFGPLVLKAMKDTIRELVNQRLSSAMDDSAKSPLPMVPDASRQEAAVAATESTNGVDGIVTTEDEKEAYQVVRAIVREVVKVDRIAMRDAKTYCAILLDNTNRKPICRLYLEKSTKYIGLFDPEKVEEKFAIGTIDDIFLYADRLKITAQHYDSVKHKEEEKV